MKIRNFTDFLNENQHNEAEELIKAFIENQCKGERPDKKLLDKAIDKLEELCSKTSTTIGNITIQDGSCTDKHICIDPVTNTLGKTLGKIEVGENHTDESVDESIDMRTRSEIVVHLKKDGINFNDDYTFNVGTFYAKDMETAQAMADSIAGTFQCTIFDDKITPEGTVPMMIAKGSQGTQQKMDI